MSTGTLCLQVRVAHQLEPCRPTAVVLHPPGEPPHFHKKGSIDRRPQHQRRELPWSQWKGEGGGGGGGDEGGEGGRAPRGQGVEGWRVRATYLRLG